eukprot:TRINITY_DN35040_c0_g1_i1.p1 TRINITY_DN35040_c0_g1~~TRINITY_DN35040_c0_g1_i1.p1  ORF type:complete len:440 (-),score=60.20 TRINITY_DN35040_c0_g1_i1:360-1679(-)
MDTPNGVPPQSWARLIDDRGRDEQRRSPRVSAPSRSRSRSTVRERDPLQDDGAATNRNQGVLAPQQPSHPLHPPGLVHPDDDAGAGGTETSAASHLADVKKMVNDQLGSKVPPALSKIIRKLTLELDQKIELLQSSSKSIAKVNSEIGEIESGKLPWSCRKHPIAHETSLLYTIVFEDPVKFGLSQQSVELQGLSIRQESRESLACTTVPPEGARLNHLPAEASDDECESSSYITKNELEAKARLIYKKPVEKAAALAKAREEEEAKACFSRQTLISKVVNLPPEEHLRNAIDSRIQAVVGTNNKKNQMTTSRPTNIDGKAVDFSKLYTTALGGGSMDQSAVEASLSKNGPSPAASGGKNQQKGNQKGQSQGGKGNDKGKGKGLSQTPKGQGKGSFSSKSTKGSSKGKTQQTTTTPQRSRARGRGRGGRGRGRGRKSGE